MGFSVKVGNICNVKCDAIVNSLGTNNSVFGRLCFSIVEASHSKELYNKLVGLTNNKVGEIILTDAGDLPCQKIINIVTPYKHQDPDNEKLKEVYISILNLAKQNRFNHICIPFIGTGANGYSEKDAYDVVTTTCCDFCDDNPKMNVDLIIFDHAQRYHTREARKEREYKEKSARSLRTFECIESDSNSNYIEKENDRLPHTNIESTEYKRLVTIIKRNNEFMMDEDDENYFIPQRNYDNIADYISDYMAFYKIRYSKYKGIVDRQEISKCCCNRQKLQRHRLLLIMYLLEMPYSVCLETMTIAGYCFSPFSKMDNFYLPYFKREKIYVSPIELNNEYYDKYGELLFNLPKA